MTHKNIRQNSMSTHARMKPTCLRKAATETTPLVAKAAKGILLAPPIWMQRRIPRQLNWLAVQELQPSYHNSDTI